MSYGYEFISDIPQILEQHAIPDLRSLSQVLSGLDLQPAECCADESV